MLSLSCIFEEIVPRLFHPHSFKVSVNKVFREQFVNGDTEILGGGHFVGEALIEIQIGVIKTIDHPGLYTMIQVGEAADHPGHGIYLSANGYFHHIVMPVAVGVAAFAVDGTVLFLAVGLGKEAMRGTHDIPAR
jgi:hypothetical protein